MNAQNLIFYFKRAFIFLFLILFFTSQVTSSHAAVVTQYSENSVDFNSTIDPISNVGTETGSITDAQSFDSSYQSLTEVNSSIGETIIEDYIDDNTVDEDGLSNQGVVTNFNNLKNTDAVYTNISEAQGGSPNDYSSDLTGGYLSCATCDVTIAQGTISFWMQFDAFTGRLFGQDGDIELRFSGSQLVWDWAGTGSATSSTSLQTGNWYFIAFSWDDTANDLLIYIGTENSAPTLDAGSLSGTSTGNVATYAAATVYYGRGYGQTTPIDGHVDDIRFFNTVRSVNDIQSDYNKTLTGSETGLVNYYQLENDYTDTQGNNDLALVNSGSFSVDTPSWITGGDFQMDQEFQFTGVVDFLDTEILAIKTGDFGGSENLNLTFWNGASWALLNSSLSSNSWNNFSVPLTSSVFTIKFGGSNTSSDTIEDWWEIDSVLLVVSGEGSQQDYVDAESNIDATTNIGTLTNFANLQSEDSNFANFAESTSSGAIWLINSEVGSSTSSTSAAINKPVSTQENDLMIALLASTITGDNNGATMAAAPSGWTEQLEYTQAAPSGQHVYLYWKLVGPSEPSSYSWTWTNNAGWVGQIITLRGVDTSSPIHVVGAVQTVNDPATTTSPVSPSVTTSVDNAMIFLHDLTDGQQIPLGGGAPTGTTWVDRTQIASPGNGVGISTALMNQTTAGATGDKTWTLNSADQASGHQLAIKPAQILNYQLDQEIEFNSVRTESQSTILSIKTGNQDTEDLFVDIWNGSSWENLFGSLSPNTWNNISVRSYISSDQLYLRFKDSINSSDSVASSWFIDAVLLTYTSSYTHYKLDWEHQVSSVDQTREKYEIAIYGNSSSSSEQFEVQLWNGTASDWITTPIMTIGSTLEWYNATISGNGIIGSTVTWRYRGTFDDDLFDQELTTLNIDYAALVSYDELPEIQNPPSDAQYNEGSVGNTIVWNISDANPDTYTVEINTTSDIGPTSWNSNELITIDIDSLARGFHNYTIIALDQNGHLIVDTVIVEVLDATPPTIIANPPTLTYTEGTTGHSLSWNTTDNYPDRYEIRRNGSLTGQIGVWDNPTNITISVDGLTKGTYAYTLTVYDESNIPTTTNIVFVVVEDNTNPVYISEPNNLTYSESSSGNTLSWNSTDNYADYYEVYRNNTLTGQTGNWDNPNNITIDIDGLTKGYYEYYLVIYDETGNSNTSSITTVTVEDTTPPSFIATSGDLVYGQGSTGHTIWWRMTDIYPGSYIIYFDGNPSYSGSWINDTDLVLPVDFLLGGSYNYTIIIFDQDSNEFTNTIWVNVITEDQLPVLIASPANTTISIDEGGSGYTFNFIATDELPYRYYIYVGESQQALIGSWYNNQATIIDVEELMLSFGLNKIRVDLEDQSQNIIGFEFFIKVVDVTSPDIINSFDNSTIIVGETDQTIVWEFYDLHPGTYQVYRNDTLISIQTWDADIIANIDGLGLGTYNFTIIVFDSSSNPTSHSLLVYVVYIKTQVPSVNISTDIYQGYSDTIAGVWNEQGGNSIPIGLVDIYLNDSLLTSGIIVNSNFEVSVNYDFTPGTYEIILIFNQASYQNHTLSYFVEIQPHDVVVGAFYGDLVPGEEYSIRVQISYDDIETTLMLNALGGKYGGVGDVMVTLNIELQFRDGSSEIYQLQGPTDSSGIVTLLLSADQTENAVLIKSIDISTEENINLIFQPLIIENNELPTVVTISSQGNGDNQFDPSDIYSNPINLAIYIIAITSVLFGLVRIVRKDKKQHVILEPVETLDIVNPDRNVIYRLSEIYSVKAVLVIDYKTRQPVFIAKYGVEDYVDDVIASISSSYTDMDSVDNIDEFIINSMDRSLSELIPYEFVNVERLLGDNLDIYLISHGEIPEISKSMSEFEHWITNNFDLSIETNLIELFNVNHVSIVQQLDLVFDMWALHDLTVSDLVDISTISDIRIKEVLQTIIDLHDVGFVDLVGKLHEVLSINELYGIIHYLISGGAVVMSYPKVQISTTQEEPILFMAIQVLSGGRISSVRFGDQDINETLLAGLISAIQSMSQSIFETKGVIENINYDEYTIAFRFQNDMMYSYVFKGPSFSLQKKFSNFFNKISDLKWLEPLAKSIVIQTEPEQLQQLNGLIHDVFLSENYYFN